MWNNLLKLTLLSYVWKRYRRTLIALPILLLYFWMVNLIHHDIIAYATLNKDTSWLGWTFLIKWLFIFFGIAVFIYLHVAAKTADDDIEHDPLKKKHSTRAAHSKTEGQNAVDAFANIRNKKTLRSKADVVIEKKQ